MIKDRCPFIEINIGSPIRAISFSADGNHLVGGGDKGLWIWRVEDAKQMAMMSVDYVQCLSVSQDGRWIATGTYSGRFIVWDAKTSKTLFVHKEGVSDIRAVDFSPDSKRLLTASFNGTASVWDVATGERVVGPLHHDSWVAAAKFSPQGDQIATATNDRQSVRVYDSSDGRLLIDIPIKVTSGYNTGILWSKEHLFGITGSAVKEVDASTGSAVSDWLVPDNNRSSCILLSHHGDFVAYSAHRTVTFRDTSTYSQLGLVQHTQDISSIALSLDDRLLAIAGEGGKVTLEYLRDVLPPSYFTVPFIDISNTVLDPWKQDRLVDTEELLTGVVSSAGNFRHHALAHRALVRTHLRHGEAAIDDVRKSIDIQPSVIGYIAQSLALIIEGKKVEGCLLFDFAFRHCHQNGVDLLLLIKAIVLFMAGKHDDALLCIDALIASVSSNSLFHVVKAHMYLLLGSSRSTERKDFEGAIQLLELAYTHLRDHTSRDLLAVSLISGWKFDNIGITTQQCLCEALYAAGRVKDADDCVLRLVNTHGKELYTRENVVNWLSDFTQQCLITPDTLAGGASRNDELCSLKPSSLLIEWARAKLTSSSWKDALFATVGFMSPKVAIYRVLCEHLETIYRITDAVECFHQMENELEQEINSHCEHEKWARDFKHSCCGKLENNGDKASEEQQHDVAITNYSAALSLHPANQHDLFIKRSKAYLAKGLWEDARSDANEAISIDPSYPWDHQQVLTEWAKVNLSNGLWKGALSAARDFTVPILAIYRILCESLETVEGISDMLECHHQMASELPDVTIMQGEQAEWVHTSRNRLSERLERFGDTAVDGQRQDEAVRHYSAALSIHAANTQGFSILRSKLCMARGLLDDAIKDADEAIAFDPSSPWGYEIKHAALHGAGRYHDAIKTFETMLLKIEQSPDLEIRERRAQYISPSDTRARIRQVVQRTIRRSPQVLINTRTGRLCSKTEQAAAFASLPIFDELVSSMVTYIDRHRIKREVKQFFQYIMLSHKWEENEPLFHQVADKAVYDLVSSPTHDKLKRFCELVRDSGFVWAWSDTCCINKEDHFVLQEALVAMFKWYRGSAMTFVFLRGVHSLAKLGAIARSIWNTRAWTLQEYVAAKVIRFYTEDWTLYLNLESSNHKVSPEIISEMEETTGVSAQQLMALRPGLSSIREKLRLASTRQTTLVEDAAYSLLGIFSVSGIPAIYGEGGNALGRLLAHILAGSGDASILAWTGQSGGYNSCLPAHISVFSRSASSHVPQPIMDVEMEDLVETLRRSALDFGLALKLYDRLSDLPAPWFAASRMKLPCIAFKLPSLSPSRTGSGRVYHAETSVFGKVEIKTKQDPSRSEDLYLVHPWLDVLLDREDNATSAFAQDDMEPSSPGADDEDTSDEEDEDDALLLPGHQSPSPPARRAPMDRETHALRLIAHLRQPFGALLLSLMSTRRRAVVYRRVAADGLIRVQIRENVALSEILENVRILDVL